MKTKIFVILLVAILSTSCREVTYNYTTIIEMNSEWGYDRDVKLLDVEGNVVSTISRGISVEYRIASELGLLSPYEVLRTFNNIGSVVFNNDVKMSLDKSVLKDETNYKLLEDKKTFRRYRYTFTYKDYQYALENGEKLNQ